MDGGAWWAAVHGVAKSRTRLCDFTFTFHFYALEKEMATHSSVLAWRIPWTEKPGRLQSMGSQSRTRLNRFELPDACRIHADAAVAGLFAAGDGGRRRRGIGHQRTRRTGARGRVVRQSVQRELTMSGAPRKFVGDHALRSGHPVPDQKARLH